ncbi:hypothetical protein GCM10009795_006960 [Nocardioides hankookensis]|uniref:PknH-like extracellular domain-containing protein n=1 Tax=Nocardioides hankookensis TaxID=443157 RepID=A0ABW1LH62_9ACTN
MPDPIDELENFTDPGLTMNPLPASEVRRRGTRMRRRNNALAAIGGVAAVAIIATPIAMAASNNTTGSSRDPGVAHSASPTTHEVTWVTSVPDDFALGDGMGTTDDPAHVGKERGEVVFSSIAICGSDVWTPEQPETTDVLGAVWSDLAEGGEQRTLALYPTEGAATDALAAMRQAVVDCPDQSTGGGDYIQPVKLRATSGDDALAYMDQYGDSAGPTGEGNAYVVTRVGNALLLDKTYFGSAGSVEVGQQTVQLLQNRAHGVEKLMCVFSADACGK